LLPPPIINGNINTNSTSNTRKIKEIKKNRIENGSRELNLGENPHSNGDPFSWSYRNFFLRPNPNKNTRITKIKLMSLNKIPK
jgi:hypothetical protein